MIVEGGCLKVNRTTGPKGAVREPGISTYFFRPTDLFFNLRSEDLHFLQRSALRGFLAPHLRHTFRKSLLFWAICFLVASAIGIL